MSWGAVVAVEVDVGGGELWALALASGVIAAVVNQVIGALRDWATRRSSSTERETERQHQLDLQGDERDHQRQLRREAAHSNARDTLLADLLDVKNWVHQEWAPTYGLDIDYSATYVVPSAVRGPVDAIDTVRRVATTHPTAAVRRAADAIENDLDRAHNEIVGGTVPDPTHDDYRRWTIDLESLIELMHVAD